MFVICVRDRSQMTSARMGGWGEGGSVKGRQKLTLTLGEKGGGGGGGPYKVDINHDTPKDWGKEKPNEEKTIIGIWSTFPWTKILAN